VADFEPLSPTGIEFLYSNTVQRCPAGMTMPMIVCCISSAGFSVAGLHFDGKSGRIPDRQCGGGSFTWPMTFVVVDKNNKVAVFTQPSKDSFVTRTLPAEEGASKPGRGA
jgi:hypothetical protein